MSQSALEIALDPEPVFAKRIAKKTAYKKSGDRSLICDGMNREAG